MFQRTSSEESWCALLMSDLATIAATPGEFSPIRTPERANGALFRNLFWT
jgi:hypothetical protein